MKQLADVIFFPLHIAPFFYFFSVSPGPLSIQTSAVFIWVRNHLSCIWHLDKVDGQRGEMRADDWERQLTVSGDIYTAVLFFFFFFSSSHTFSLLHSNRLTNVPWKFTLDAGSGGSKKGRWWRLRKGWSVNIEVVCTLLFFFFIQSSCWLVM